MAAETHPARRSDEGLDLRNLIETIPALVLCALPDGSVEFANRAWQEYTGIAANQLSDSGWQTTIHPADAPAFINEWNAAHKTGRPFSAEARVRQTDGQYRWFLIRKALAIAPNQGADSSLRTLIACEDINERKQAEARLYQSEIQLQAFFENSPSMIFLKDLDGRYLYANREFKRVRHITQEQINGKTDIELFPAEQAWVFQASDRQVLEAGVAIEFEQVSVQNDGQHTSIVQKFPVFNPDGKIYAIGGIVTDVTERKRAQEKLRESETRLQAFFKHSPNLIFMKDPQGRYLYVNQEVERVLRITEEQIKGKRDDEVFPQEQAAAYQAAEYQANDRQVLQAGTPMEFEEIFVKEDGPHTTIVHKFPLFNAEGAIYAIGGVATDITERKREEAARRYSEERHRLVVETANDAVVSMDDSGVIRFANPATMRIFGYDPTELIGKPLAVLMPESLRKMHEAGFRRYLATGQRHINWQGMEVTALRKSGEEFPVEISFGEQTRDGHKVFTGFIRDISERKQAEDRLRASERTLRQLTETIPQMLWSAEPDGANDYCNQRVLGYTGLSAEQVRGAGWMQAVHPDDIETLARAWTAAISSGEPFQQEFRCLRATDHAYRWCISRAVPLRDPDGRIIKWFGTVVDLHDWKEAQQALQMTQAELARVSRLTTMGELAASIAHEVNQPLTAVTNNGSACLRLLANRNLDPEVLRHALEEIVADGIRASAVIARIRALIKKAPAEKSELDINEVIQEVLTLVSHELRTNGVQVECRLTRRLPLVRGDRVQLQQVMLNLILNSMEAMVGVGAEPRALSLESRIDESGDVLVAVRDSGTGLGLEADRVFTPFYTTKVNGMGMGLSISRSLVESHGGRLWATSNSPRGAVFCFTLPVASGSAS